MGQNINMKDRNSDRLINTILDNDACGFAHQSAQTFDKDAAQGLGPKSFYTSRGGKKYDRKKNKIRSRTKSHSKSRSKSKSKSKSRSKNKNRRNKILKNQKTNLDRGFELKNDYNYKNDVRNVQRYAKNSFIERNKRWIEKQQNKQIKAKETAENMKMKECTFQPNVTARISVKKRQSDQLRSKISRSMSPNNVFQLDNYDMSVIKKSRMRIERDDDKPSSYFIDQVSPEV